MKPIDGELRLVTVIGGYVGYRLLEDAEEHRKSLEEFWPGLQSRLVSLEQEVVNVQEDPGWRDLAAAEEILETEKIDTEQASNAVKA